MTEVTLGKHDRDEHAPEFTPPAAPAPATVHIEVNELRFYQRTPGKHPVDDWSELKEIKRGMVGCVNMDRALPWDLFVVIGPGTDANKIKCIFPRLRFDAELGKVVLGQDRTIENSVQCAQCTCPPISQGMDFYCHCGAFKRNRDAYQATFVECDIEYVVHEIENINLRTGPPWRPWLEWVSHGMINGLDCEGTPRCC